MERNEQVGFNKIINFNKIIKPRELVLSITKKGIISSFTGDKQLLTNRKASIIRKELPDFFINGYSYNIKKSLYYLSVEDKETVISGLIASDFENLDEKPILDMFFVKDKKFLSQKMKVIIRNSNHWHNYLSDNMAKNNLKKEEMVDLGHEIRTPLNAIIGFSQVISKEIYGKIQNEKYIEYSELIEKSGKYIIDLLSGAMENYGDKVQIEQSNCNIIELVNDAVNIIKLQAQKKGLDISIEYENDDFIGYIDKKIFQQILLNILTNSIKFTSKGSIRIIIKKIESFFKISVIDTGVGMTEKELSKFQKRYVSGSNFKNGFEGLGLGIPLSMRLCELHGGLMVYRSKKNIGTKVHFYLPIDFISKDKSRELFDIVDELSPKKNKITKNGEGNFFFNNTQSEEQKKLMLDKIISEDESFDKDFIENDNVKKSNNDEIAKLNDEEKNIETEAAIKKTENKDVEDKLGDVNSSQGDASNDDDANQSKSENIEKQPKVMSNKSNPYTDRLEELKGNEDFFEDTNNKLDQFKNLQTQKNDDVDNEDADNNETVSINEESSEAKNDKTNSNETKQKDTETIEIETSETNIPQAKTEEIIKDETEQKEEDIFSFLRKSANDEKSEKHAQNFTFPQEDEKIYDQKDDQKDEQNLSKEDASKNEHDEFVSKQNKETDMSNNKSKDNDKALEADADHDLSIIFADEGKEIEKNEIEEKQEISNSKSQGKDKILKKINDKPILSQKNDEKDSIRKSIDNKEIKADKDLQDANITKDDKPPMNIRKQTSVFDQILKK